MNTFSPSESIKYGWETFKKRPWFFVGIALVIFVVSAIGNMFSPGHGKDMYGVVALAGFLISTAISILVDMGGINVTLKAHENVDTVEFKDLWHPQTFWKYLGAGILTGLCVLAGLILLIIPGIIVGLMLMFVKYLVIERNLSPVAALKESNRITKGHKWPLLGLLAMVILLNLIGALLIGVGLLVSVPVTMLALVHAYRTLERQASEIAPATSA